MKKNIIRINLAAVLLLGFAATSCRDAVDIVQPGEINGDQFFISVDNLQGFLQGDVYKSVNPFNSIKGASLMSDELKANTDAANLNFNLNINADNGYAQYIWSDNYTIINKVNILLDGAKKITPTADQTAKYNQILAEAKTLRVFAYLELMKYFSEDMKNPDGLGVIIVPGVPSISDKLPRSTNQQVFSAMESDLDFSVQYLPQSSRYYASKNFANALRARMNLYRENYSEAKKFAQKVLSESGLSLTKATPIPTSAIGSADWNKQFYADNSVSPYRAIWSDAAQGEVIFSLARLETETGSAIGTMYNSSSSDAKGNPVWYMSTNLYNILNTTAGDIRRYAFVDPTSTSGSPIIDKYPGKGTAPVRNDIKLFRLSEIYFILAECAVAENNLPAAAQYINSVRIARNYANAAVTPSYASQQAAFADILKERRVELAFEGHRLIDLKRLAAKAGVKMDRSQYDVAGSGQLVQLENNDYRYTLPIPSAEISGNPSIKQNKNY